MFAEMFLPLKVSTSSETAVSRDSLMPVRNSVWSAMAVTISASDVLPARSPNPFTLVWMPAAPD